MTTPGIRGNLLMGGKSFDDLELSADLVGFFNMPVVGAGLIVWAEPWNRSGMGSHVVVLGALGPDNKRM